MSVFEIVVRVIAAVFLALNYWAYRRILAYLDLHELPPKRRTILRRVVLAAVVILNLPWFVVLLFGLEFRLRSTESVWTAFYVFPYYAYQFTVFVMSILAFFNWVLKSLVRLTALVWKRFSEKAEEVQPVETAIASRRAFLKKAGIVLPAGVLAATTYGMLRSQLNYVVNRIEITVDGLPERLKGYTITQLSDFHVGPFVGAERLREMIDVANNLSSDMIVITGDVINDTADVFSYAGAHLARLSARDGVFFCMGNHDYIADRSGMTVIRAMKDTGARVLVNESARLNINGEEINLAGVQYIGSGNAHGRRYFLDKTMQKVPDDGAPTILLAHHPIIFDEVKGSKHKIDITLSGHTHGGQIVLAEFAGKTISPMFAHKYLKGRYRSGTASLYVNSGLGHWLPVRINCPPEFTKITLV